MIKNLVRASSALLLVFMPLLAAAPASAVADAPKASGPDPVVFVHGWNPDPSPWRSMATRFEADGWPADHLDQWSYNSTQANATTAAQLAEEIDRVLARTGATKVDVVTHSMGALSSRYYLKYLGGAAKVDAWVSLGGPNHGTEVARWCGGAACVEMRPGSVFLKDLNSGDETPGTTRYATWRSPCDTLINPPSSVVLDGALNSTTACLGHSALRTDGAVYAEVRTHVR
ncbi:triacylglycerol lipase [Streptomyces sp. NPDC005409]|uniref:esterase/lipase family protein n=1 Tax=Streptomyces sp. NPDC005409 TaxID=3155342 RepID=UPI00345262B9